MLKKSCHRFPGFGKIFFYFSNLKRKILYGLPAISLILSAIGFNWFIRVISAPIMGIHVPSFV
jgi:hypothetical protein